MSKQGFWARRQAAVKNQRREDAPGQNQPDELREPTAGDDRCEQEVLASLGLPDPDSLGAGDDFSEFMKKTVPHYLRNRALRRLWVSNPVLANVDGLLDYGEDFTDAATVLPDMQTGYRVGRGMQKHLNTLLQDTPSTTPSDKVEQPEPAPMVQESTPCDPLDEEGDKLSELELSKSDAATAEPLDMAAPAKPGHMKFEFS